jgi:cytochrome c oxidase cbb3-type subunit 2
MIRPLRDEIERYGHYSLAAESMYDKPFQWGSKRTGPDLARVGGKYSDEWQLAHLNRPRDLVPQSIMPGYPFLARTPLRFEDIADALRANRVGGVPYTDEMIARAASDLEAQATPDHPGASALEARYPKVEIRDFDGNAGRVSEADALIAYLQVLGTLVDFKIYDDKANIR